VARQKGFQNASCMVRSSTWICRQAARRSSPHVARLTCVAADVSLPRRHIAIEQLSRIAIPYILAEARFLVYCYSTVAQEMSELTHRSPQNAPVCWRTGEPVRVQKRDVRQGCGCAGNLREGMLCACDMFFNLSRLVEGHWRAYRSRFQNCS
jgi:hypothetical protein